MDPTALDLMFPDNGEENRKNAMKKFTQVTEVIGEVVRGYEGVFVDVDDKSMLELENIIPNEVINSLDDFFTRGPKCKIKITVECEPIEEEK